MVREQRIGATFVFNNPFLNLNSGLQCCEIPKQAMDLPPGLNLKNRHSFRKTTRFLFWKTTLSLIYKQVGEIVHYWYIVESSNQMMNNATSVLIPALKSVLRASHNAPSNYHGIWAICWLCAATACKARNEKQILLETPLSRLRTISIAKDGVSFSSNLVLACAHRGIRLLCSTGEESQLRHNRTASTCYRRVTQSPISLFRAKESR